MGIKLLVGLLVLLCAVLTSAVAAYFSVVGLAALFAAAFIPVAIMGAILEGSKLVAAGWLHSNWENPRVSRPHKIYLVTAIVTLMAITSMGIYGYLARAHIEQKAPTASVQIDISQKEIQIEQLVAQRDQLLVQQKSLNETVGAYLGKGSANGASRFIYQQKGQQAALAQQIADLNKQITTQNVELAPLKKQMASADVELGPIKYIAKALGLKDPESAVNLVILMLMFAFDPLAVVMMISGTITIGEWQRMRDEKSKADNIIMPVTHHEVPENVLEDDPEEFLKEVSGEPVESEEPVIYPPKPTPLGTVDKEPWDTFFKDVSVKTEEPEPEPEPEPEIKVQEPIDAKAQLISLLEQNPEFIDELVQVVEEVKNAKQPEIKEEPEKSIAWLDPK